MSVLERLREYARVQHVVLAGEDARQLLAETDRVLNREPRDLSAVRFVHGIRQADGSRDWYVEPPYEPPTDGTPMWLVEGDE